MKAFLTVLSLVSMMSTVAAATSVTTVVGKGSTTCTFPNGTCGRMADSTNAAGKEDLAERLAAQDAQYECSRLRGTVISAEPQNGRCDKDFKLGTITCKVIVASDCMVR